MNRYRFLLGAVATIALSLTAGPVHAAAGTCNAGGYTDEIRMLYVDADPADLPILYVQPIHVEDATTDGDTIAQLKSTTMVNFRELDPTRSGELPAGPCLPACKDVAFAARGNSHVSAAGETLIGYPETLTNIGGGWIPGGGSFVAPCSGLYSFTVNFQKDHGYHGGTDDDVMVILRRNGMRVGYAWAGESPGSRGSGSYSVVLSLNQGDYLQSFAFSDGNPPKIRHLMNFSFTGHRLRRCAE